jgi:sporulation protein YlmC with PRC-barrel domain
MRLSELLGAEVVDADGRVVGTVHDARFVRDGPVQGLFGAAYRLQALVVGPASIGVRLGYDRSRMGGPAPLKAAFRRIHRRARLVEWSRIASVEPGTIRLAGAAPDLPPVPDLPSVPPLRR